MQFFNSNELKIRQRKTALKRSFLFRGVLFIKPVNDMRDFIYQVEKIFKAQLAEKDLEIENQKS